MLLGWLQNFMSGATGAPQAAYSNAVDTSYSSYPTQASMYPTNPATGPTTAAYASHYNTSYGYWESFNNVSQTVGWYFPPPKNLVALVSCCKTHGVWHSLLEPLCLFFTSLCPHFKFLRRGFCHLVAVVKAPQRNGVWFQQMQVWFTEASVKGLCLAYISTQSEFMRCVDYILIYTHCSELMKSVGGHCGTALLFVIRAMVWHFVRDSHMVMRALTVMLLSNCGCP